MPTDSVCAYGVSNSAATGPVGNPYDKTRSAGGSSSGCGVLVATGIADMALGGDQGGSIRIVSQLSSPVHLSFGSSDETFVLSPHLPSVLSA